MTDELYELGARRRDDAASGRADRCHVATKLYRSTWNGITIDRVEGPFGYTECWLYFVEAAPGQSFWTSEDAKAAIEHYWGEGRQEAEGRQMTGRDQPDFTRLKTLGSTFTYRGFRFQKVTGGYPGGRFAPLTVYGR